MALSLAFEQAEPGVMARSPRKRSEPFFFGSLSLSASVCCCWWSRRCIS
nr:hypothetical protein [Chlorobium sp.]